MRNSTLNRYLYNPLKFKLSASGQNKNYEGICQKTNKQVYVKMVSIQPTMEACFNRRHRETSNQIQMEVLTKISYKNIQNLVQLHENIQHRYIIVVTERLPYSIAQFLKERQKLCSNIEQMSNQFQKNLSIFLQIVQGVAVLWANGYLHANIQTSILITENQLNEEPSKITVKIGGLDFCIHKHVLDRQESIIYRFSGIVANRAPQLTNEGRFNQKTMMFDLGIVFNQLISIQLPKSSYFSRNNEARLSETSPYSGFHSNKLTESHQTTNLSQPTTCRPIPSSLQSIILSCVNPSPCCRYTFLELLYQLVNNQYIMKQHTPVWKNFVSQLLTIFHLNSHLNYQPSSASAYGLASWQVKWIFGKFEKNLMFQYQIGFLWFLDRCRCIFGKMEEQIARNNWRNEQIMEQVQQQSENSANPQNCSIRQHTQKLIRIRLLRLQQKFKNSINPTSAIPNSDPFYNSLVSQLTELQQLYQLQNDPSNSNMDSMTYANGVESWLYYQQFQLQYQRMLSKYLVMAIKTVNTVQIQELQQFHRYTVYGIDLGLSMLAIIADNLKYKHSNHTTNKWYMPIRQILGAGPMQRYIDTPLNWNIKQIYRNVLVRARSMQMYSTAL